MLPRLALASAEVAVVERQGDVAGTRQAIGVQTDHLLFDTGERPGEHERRQRPAVTVGRASKIAGQRQSVADELNRFRDDVAHSNRLTKANAVSATSRQPLSMVNECPRPFISLISVTPP